MRSSESTILPASAASTAWVEVLRQIPDPRAQRGRRYALGDVADADLRRAGERRPHRRGDRAVGAGACAGVAALAVDVREDASLAPRRCAARSSGWMWRRSKRAWLRYTEQAGTGQHAALRALAVDGKAVRGAQRHGAKVHLVSLVTHQQTQVLGQVAVADKSNEIPAARTLLHGRDLRDCLVTLDAMHTQRETARLIRAQGGHYLMVVKANQPELYGALVDWFAEAAWADEQEAQVTTCDVGHGRHEHRTLTRRVVEERLLGWPGVRQALRRVTWAHLQPRGEMRREVTYAVTSVPAALAAPEALEAAWRGHWRIENQLHYVRDVTCQEDAGQAHRGSTPQALAALRNGLLSLLRRHGHTQMAAAFRHLGASVPRALRFLGGSLTAS